MKDTESALKWIISLLNSEHIPYQITGGFAARMYGSKRPLADIDIEIKDNDFKKIALKVESYVVYGPEQYIDENWDLKLMTLEYKGQLIDICGEATIFDQNTKEWVRDRLDFGRAVDSTIYGIKIKLTPKSDLISYKSKLLRDVDFQDLKFLKDTRDK